MIDQALIADLLGRPEDRFEASQEALSGKTILVTGAGGSIGSELCRCLARSAPRKIIALDHSEERLVKFLRHSTVTPYLADIRDEPGMHALFADAKPDVIFHAAAFKHVALLEQFPFEAIENNTLATVRLAELADRLGVERFLLLSTDKAADPISVMGASKRLAEILLPRGHSETSFASLRCGNVMGSSGSVLPIWLEQIAAGEPLTITDARAQRFFVSVAEIAGALLTLGANPAARGLFSYALHAPLVVGELAQRLIEHSRLSHNSGVVTVGLQPGEKMCESMCAADEKMGLFCHEQIVVIESCSAEDIDTLALQDNLEISCRERDLSLLQQVITEVIPQHAPTAENREALLGV